MNDARSLADQLDRLLDADAALRTLPRDQRDRLLAFVALLSKWNRVWNLTAVRDPGEMLSRHLLDSLSLLPSVDAAALDMAADVDLLDIGSGAGLPVLPLAIARPALACLSVERTGKKARFQRQAALELGLDGVRVRAERIEAIEVSARIVTSRAFTAPGAFLSLAARYVAPGGCALVMLGKAERLPDPLPAPFTLAGVHRIAAEPARHVAVCLRSIHYTAGS